LDQKLVSPGVEGIEGFRVIDIIDKNAAIGTTVESDTKRLKPFLASSIPQLLPQNYELVHAPKSKQ